MHTHNEQTMVDINHKTNDFQIKVTTAQKMQEWFKK